jgi:hypothetical protein
MGNQIFFREFCLSLQLNSLCLGQNVLKLVSQAITSVVTCTYIQIVSLTKVARKNKEQKNALLTEVNGRMTIRQFMPNLKFIRSRRILTDGNTAGLSKELLCGILILRPFGISGKSTSKLRSIPTCLLISFSSVLRGCFSDEVL